MRKLLYLFLIVSSFVACSEDEELDKLSDEVTADEVTHTWTVTEYYLLNGKIQTEIEGIPVTANLDLTGKDFDATTTLSQNPNMISSEGGFTVVANVSYLTLSKTQEYEQPFLFYGSWSIANNTITMTSGTVTNNYEIVEFTENTLKLKQEFNETFENIEGYSGVATGSLYIGFTR